MSYNKHYRLLRVKCVQIFDAMYYEPGNQQKCHRQIWKKAGHFIFGISYDTYLSYLKIDTSHISDIPSEAVAQIDALVQELLSREKNPRRLEKTKKPKSRKK